MSAGPPWTGPPRTGPPRPGWSGGRHSTVPGPDMRVSDAERSEVADILARNFGEGRLDQTEFDERMQKAMAAKTRADLAGLLTDLPASAPPVPEAADVRRRRGHFGLVLLAVFLFMVAASAPVWPYHFPWLFFAVVMFLVWRVTRRGWWWRRRYERWH
jgi:hypothetical protein